MMKRFLSASLVVAAGLSAASCGGEADLTSAGGSIDAGALSAVLGAGALNNFIASIKPAANGNVTLPVVPLPGGVGALEAGPDFSICKVEQGSKTDGADNDGIPLFFRQDFNCNGVPGGPGTSDLVGHYEVRDFDNTKHGFLGGYSFDFDMSYVNNFSHEVNIGRWGGTWSVTTSGNSFTSVNNYFYEGGSTPTAQPDKASVWKATNKYTQTLTAENIAQPWQAGTTQISGFYGISGTIYVDQLAQKYELGVVFEITSSNLTYDRNACAGTFFKDGSITMTDGGGNVLEYTYANCVESRTFNGQTLQNF